MQETTTPYLAQYGLMAERHWREFRPKMVRELEAQGRLMEMLFDAQETTKTEMETLRHGIPEAGPDGAAGARSGMGDREDETIAEPEETAIG